MEISFFRALKYHIGQRCVNLETNEISGVTHNLCYKMMKTDKYKYLLKRVDFNMNKMTPYEFHEKLSEGYDLFGLIDRGYALEEAAFLGRQLVTPL